jgi:acyl carrier protein
MTTDELQMVVLETVRLFGRGQVDRDTLLLESGMFDSMSIIQIMLTLEHRLGLRFNSSDLSYEHFSTCRVLSDRVAQLWEAAS